MRLTLRTISLVTCLLAWGWTAAFAQDIKPTEAWYAISLNGVHAGYFMYEISEHKDEAFQVDFEGSLSMRRMDFVIPMSAAGSGIMTKDGEMERFTIAARSGGDPMEFVVESKGENYVISGPMFPQPLEFPKDSPMFSDEKLMKEMDITKLEPGAVQKLDMQDMQMTLTYLRNETLTIDGSERPHAVIQVANPMMPIGTQVMWVDKENGGMGRMDMAMPPMFNLSMVRTTAKEAMKPVESPEVFFQSLQPVTPGFPGPAKVESITFKVTSRTNQEVPAIPETKGRQEVQKTDDGGYEVTVQRKALPESFPLKKIKTKKVDAFLQPEFGIEADDEAIRAFAEELRGKEKDAVAIVTKFRDWVNANMTGSLGVGLAGAKEVFTNRTGDCTEHSVLLVAMLRAVGVPSRTVTGIVYAPREQALGGHMWVEVYLDGWYPVDAALDMAETDPGYLKTGEGLAIFDEQGGLGSMATSVTLTMGTEVTIAAWKDK